MSNYWVPTFSGKKLDVMEPDPRQICLMDIAHALGSICRFGGHLSRHYSVAEHSVRVSHLVPGAVAKLGLLHDAAEAYLGDMVRPIKRRPEMQEYRVAESRLLRVILTKYEIPTDKHLTEQANLEAIDLAMPFVEAKLMKLHPNADAMPPLPEDTTKEVRALGQWIYSKMGDQVWGWKAEFAKNQFLQRAWVLGVRDDE